MKSTIFIRKENIELTEKRAPLTPAHVKQLISEKQTAVIVENWNNRIFSGDQYKESGAVLSNNSDSANIILGVKEIPINDLPFKKACVFFSHTIKGQPYNMPLLQAILEKQVTLMDYEKVTDAAGKRLMFFGPYAGLVGAINTVWLLGKRLKTEGIDNPFSEIKQAMSYSSLAEAKDALKNVGTAIESHGLPNIGKPWVFAITGNGTVSKGAQEIIDILPITNLTPHEFLELQSRNAFDLHTLYKVVIDCDNFVKPLDSYRSFDWSDYFQNPKAYMADFKKYLPNIMALINGIYWDTPFPKLVTKVDLKNLFENENQPALRIISDITCDVEGSIECNLKSTTSENPSYVYNPFSDAIDDNIGGIGPLIMAVDKLPSELPKESSTFFGDSLMSFIPALARADYSMSFEKLDIPAEFKRATITHQGKLTPDFEYLSKHLL